MSKELPGWFKVKPHPVIEVFGPVAQGEGHFAGQVTHFVRFGGCDYRCSWCDSKYAVAPVEVRENAEMLVPAQIVNRLAALDGSPGWVVLSGGNPALHHLELLVDMLHREGYKVMVETQGSAGRLWLKHADHITISPKPPSSGMPRLGGDKVVDWIYTNLRRDGELPLSDVWDAGRVSVKIVVFDDADYDYAKSVLTEPDLKGCPAYLSVGTKTPETSGEWTTPWPEVDDNDSLLDRYRWLLEKAAADPEMGHVSVLCQQHTLLYGHARGV